MEASLHEIKINEDISFPSHGHAPLVAWKAFGGKESNSHQKESRCLWEA